jgi:hypothetical protein
MVQPNKKTKPFADFSIELTDFLTVGVTRQEFTLKMSGAPSPILTLSIKLVKDAIPAARPE